MTPWASTQGWSSIVGEVWQRQDGKSRRERAARRQITKWEDHDAHCIPNQLAADLQLYYFHLVCTKSPVRWSETKYSSECKVGGEKKYGVWLQLVYPKTIISNICNGMWLFLLQFSELLLSGTFLFSWIALISGQSIWGESIPIGYIPD